MIITTTTLTQQGDILEDIALIENLEQTKRTAVDIEEKVKLAKQTEVGRRGPAEWGVLGRAAARSTMCAPGADVHTLLSIIARQGSRTQHHVRPLGPMRAHYYCCTFGGGSAKEGGELAQLQHLLVHPLLVHPLQQSAGGAPAGTPHPPGGAAEAPAQPPGLPQHSSPIPPHHTPPALHMCRTALTS